MTEKDLHERMATVETIVASNTKAIEDMAKVLNEVATDVKVNKRVKSIVGKAVAMGTGVAGVIAAYLGLK